MKHEAALRLLTNHRRFGAPTIPSSRQRWQIDLFFKAPKQKLRIKTLVGNSANAADSGLDRPNRAAPAQVTCNPRPLRLKPDPISAPGSATRCPSTEIPISWIDQSFQPPPQLTHIAEQNHLSKETPMPAPGYQ